MAAAILELIYLAFIAAGALAVGNFARQPLHKSDSKLEVFLVSSGLGFIILSLLLYFLGILKLYTPPAFILVHVLLMLLIVVQAGKLTRIAMPDFSWLKSSNSNFIIRLMFAIFVVFTFLNMVVATAPPTSADALLHHLTAPKIYIAEHGIVNMPSLQLMTEAPMSVNMLYLYGLELRNGKLSQAIAWYLGFLASLAVFLIASRLISKEAGIMAATLFVTLPIFSVFNVRAYVDIPLAFFALLATSLFLEWVEKVQMHSAILTGLFLGMAVSAKNIGMLVGAALAITTVLMLMRMQPQARAKFFAQAITAGLVAAALLSPWLIKSFINTGNPLHPFLYQHFGGTYWNSGLGRILLEFHKSQGIGFSLLSLIAFPYQMTVNPSLFADTAGITPTFLGFLPLLLLLRKRIPKPVLALLIFAAALVVLQFFTAQQTRYMFVVWAIMSVITAYIVFSFRTEKLVQAGLYAFVVLGLLVNAALWAAANLDDLPVALGTQPEQEYLSKKVPTYAATEFLAAIDKEAVVCWYGEGRGFWSKNPYVWCNPLYQGYVNFFDITTTQQLAARLSELNVSYVLFEKKMRNAPLYGNMKVFSDNTAGYFLNSTSLVTAYLADFAQKVYEDKNTEIYKIS